jgi:hypothetical protein
MRTNRTADDCGAERTSANAGMDCLALTKPARPAIEFTKINNAETADACFVFAHLEKRRRGVRKIPPPVPVRPERNPIPEHTASAAGRGGGGTARGQKKKTEMLGVHHLLCRANIEVRSMTKHE